MASRNAHKLEIHRFLEQWVWDAACSMRDLATKYVTKNSAPRAVYEAKLTRTSAMNDFEQILSFSA